MLIAFKAVSPQIVNGGFPKLGVPCLGPVRIKILGGLYWGPSIPGNYQMGPYQEQTDEAFFGGEYMGHSLQAPLGVARAYLLQERNIAYPAKPSFVLISLKSPAAKHAAALLCTPKDRTGSFSSHPSIYTNQIFLPKAIQDAFFQKSTAELTSNHRGCRAEGSSSWLDLAACRFMAYLCCPVAAPIITHE